MGIISRHGDQVKVNFVILEDMDAPVADYDIFNFVTSRAVLI